MIINWWTVIVSVLTSVIASVIATHLNRKIQEKTMRKKETEEAYKLALTITDELNRNYGIFVKSKDDYSLTNFLEGKAHKDLTHEEKVIASNTWISRKTHPFKNESWKSIQSVIAVKDIELYKQISVVYQRFDGLSEYITEEGISYGHLIGYDLLFYDTSEVFHNLYGRINQQQYK